MKWRSIIHVFLLLAMIIMATPIYPSDKVHFPEKVYAVDPTEKYIIEWERQDQESKGYTLYLRHTTTKYKKKLMDFLEKTEVFWSPDGSFFTVAEWNGAYFSDILIYSVSSSDDVIDLQEVLARSFKKIGFIKENETVIFEAIKWVDNDRIVFKVYGSGKNDPNGFEKFFEYKIGSRAREIKR